MGSVIRAVTVESTAAVSAIAVSLAGARRESAKQVVASIVIKILSIVVAFIALFLFIVFSFHNCHYMGVLIDSTRFCTSSDGEGVNLDTTKDTAKLIIIPRVPIPSGEIPNHQCSAEFNSGLMNLK